VKLILLLALLTNGNHASAEPISSPIDCTGRPSAQPTAAADPTSEAALRKACEFLWSQQADDGGWHSQQYAVMRSGQALTPFVLHTLLGTIESMNSDDTGRVMRAVEFIRKHIDEDGSIGHADPDILEYPVYSTTYSVLCLKRIQAYRHLRREENDRLIARMEAYLVDAQFGSANGFTPEMPAYGGWGFDRSLRPGDSGHMDLAHTRRALQALASVYKSGPPPRTGTEDLHAPIVDRAQSFLRLVQKHPDAVGRQRYSYGTNGSIITPPYDGGFYFSPVVVAANKGREESNDAGEVHLRSYATASCDGILALLACGVNREDERLVRAVEWLKEHDDLTYPEGVPTDHPEPWGEAIRFYHYAVRAEAYAALDWPGDWRIKLAAEVTRHQADDGSFRNTVSPLMKEDDPILATALAAIALTHCASESPVAAR